MASGRGAHENRKDEVKAKKCKACGETFTPARPFQSTCSAKCAIEHAKKLLEKSRKNKILKEKKSWRQSDKAHMLQEAQKAFNSYIRARDKGNLCISCGRKVEKGDASHFFNVGSFPSVRFNLWNVHLSCQSCNRFKGGNKTEYIERLIEKIGIDRFNRLSELRHERKKFDLVYLRRICEIFKRKKSRLSKS